MWFSSTLVVLWIILLSLVTVACFFPTNGDLWVFLGIRMYMLLHPYEGDREDVWLVAPCMSVGEGVVAGMMDGTRNVYDNVGGFDMTSAKWRRITRALLAIWCGRKWWRPRPLPSYQTLRESVERKDGEDNAS
jgi:hypothetical protein